MPAPPPPPPPAIPSSSQLQLPHKRRRTFVTTHQVTYAATVGHVIGAIRKLVRYDTAVPKLYRGVRGEVTDLFWKRDPFGNCTATEFGFLSSSMDAEQAITFLNGEENVLIELQCSKESDIGYHSAASVSICSQFPDEKEVLFPPLTGLTIETTQGDFNGELNCKEIKDKEGKVLRVVKYRTIRATPTFV